MSCWRMVSTPGREVVLLAKGDVQRNPPLMTKYVDFTPQSSCCQPGTVEN